MKIVGKNLTFNGKNIYHGGNKLVASDVLFTDGKTLQQKLDDGSLKGEKGDTGTFDSTTIFNSLNTSNKTVIGAINELLNLINKGDNSGGDNGEETIIPVKGITVDDWNIALTVGQTRQMIASVIPSNATNQIIYWYSDYPNVATVNETGLITAINPGYAKITVTTDDGGFKYDVHVNVSENVVEPEPEPPTPNPDNNITVDSSYTIKPTEMLEISYTTNINIPSYCAWELRQNGTYLVSAYRDTSSGKVVCYTGNLSIGTHDNLTIVAKNYVGNEYVDIATSNTFSIIVSSYSGGGSDSGGSGGTTTSGIKVEPASISIETGKTADVTISFGSNVTNKNIEYMSSSGAIASVSDLGSYRYRITGVGQGQTSIRFRTSDGKFETSCSVTVTASSSGGGGISPEPSNEYTKSCTPEYILDKMYPMGQAHEAIPNGNITGWKHNSRWENQYRPTAMAHNCGQSGCPGTGAFQALGCWSNIYRVEGTPFTQNTGVEMKDIKVYGWYNGKWELVQHLPIPNGNFYPESFGGDVNKYFADSIKQTSISKTIILREKNKIDAMNWNTNQLQTENCMYHPFSDVKNFDTKYEYIYTCIDLRKVKWDENGVDDRDQTHYCSNCGGDWWLAEGLLFHDSWQHNKGVAQPKMIEITKEWRRFSMTTVPQGWSNGFPK
jgi:uncharacterized protein YjdB|nr:MAG TPA: tail tube protein [Ackermannviridae sp.]